MSAKVGNQEQDKGILFDFCLDINLTIISIQSFHKQVKKRNRIFDKRITKTIKVGTDHFALQMIHQISVKIILKNMRWDGRKSN